MAASIGAGAALLSAGSSIAGGLFGKSNAGNVQMPAPLPYVPNAAGTAYNQIGTLPATDWGRAYLPQYAASAEAAYNNPYAPGAQAGAITAGQMGQQGAINTFNTGQGIVGQGQSIVPYATSIANTAFDPQQALYNRTVQQLTDQVRSGEAARGIATSPYGAGVENKALSDFNIDWQNAQLARQIAGGNAYGALSGQSAQQQTQGLGLENAAPQFYNTASAMPYTTAQGITSDQMAALSKLFSGGSQGQTLAQTPIQDYLSYIQTATGAQNANTNTFNALLNQANAGFNQNQTLGAGIGSGLGIASNQNNWNWLNSVFNTGGGGGVLPGGAPLGQGGIGSA